ncbi:MAG: NAD-dependent epimerase/dehydratase family protein, partial [bacterium]
MKILITGATGFLGTALTRRLIKEGHSLRLIVRNPSRAESIFS